LKELEKSTKNIRTIGDGDLAQNDMIVNTTLHEYLKKEPYLELYVYLIDGQVFKGLFEPLVYFDLLSGEMDFFIKNADDFVKIKSHYDNLGLESQKRYFFLHPFKGLITQHYSEPTNKKTVVIEKSIELILKMFEIVDKEIFPHREKLSPLIPKPTNTFPYGNHQGLPANIEYHKVINQDLVPYHPTPAYLDRKFTWQEVLLKLEETSDYKDKIMYLINISTEYQHFGIEGANIDETFLDQCELEIKKLKSLEELQLKPKLPQIEWELRQGKKTDFIRVLNALYELSFFDGLKKAPTKKEFMEYAGKAFGIDLTDYQKSLSQAKQVTALEANLKIFEEMKTATTTYISKKNQS